MNLKDKLSWDDVLAWPVAKKKDLILHKCAPEIKDELGKLIDVASLDRSDLMFPRLIFYAALSKYTLDKASKKDMIRFRSEVKNTIESIKISVKESEDTLRKENKAHHAQVIKSYNNIRISIDKINKQSGTGKVTWKDYVKSPQFITTCSLGGFIAILMIAVLTKI